MSSPQLDVHLMACPGPGYVAQPIATRWRLGDPIQPVALIEPLVKALAAGQALGLNQVVLPPPPLAINWQRVDGGDPEWIESELHSAPVDTQHWALVLAGDDCSHGETVVIPANRCGERAGQWLPQRQELLSQALAALPGLRLLPPQPAAPHLADTGQANHCRLRVADQPAAQLLAYGHALTMPESWRARASCVQGRAALLRNLDAAQLQPGRSIIARQMWRSIEAGASVLRDVICGDEDRWLIHESACGEQVDVLGTMEKLVPGLRLRVIREKECRLRELPRNGTLGGTLLRDGGGRRLLLYDPRSSDRRSQALRQQLLDEGFIDHAEADIDPRPLGLRRSGSWRLRLPLSAAQLAAMPKEWLVQPPLLGRLTAWCAAHRDLRLPLDDLGQAASREQLHAAHQALHACFDPPSPDLHHD